MHKERYTDKGKHNRPEPQEDVDFFVDDVERENAKSVLVFDGAGRSVLVERALRHLREDSRKRI